ncbi:hypothetical protein F4801DRAFT_5462 [Xylaria longipes]|nr:hypothetical protein F4801DRAFT_5462 [Xylaria longipes]
MIVDDWSNDSSTNSKSMRKRNKEQIEKERNGKVREGKGWVVVLTFFFSSILYQARHCLEGSISQFIFLFVFLSSNLYFDDSSPICAYFYATFVASHRVCVCVCMLVYLWYGFDLCVARQKQARPWYRVEINNEALEYTTSIARHQFPASSHLSLLWVDTGLLFACLDRQLKVNGYRRQTRRHTPGIHYHGGI